MGDRLTHLILANNRLAAIPQLITAIAVSISADSSFDHKYLG
jgi:hypothetical protein